MLQARVQPHLAPELALLQTTQIGPPCQAMAPPMEEHQMDRYNPRGWQRGGELRPNLCQSPQVQRHQTKRACSRCHHERYSLSRIHRIHRKPQTTHTWITNSSTGLRQTQAHLSRTQADFRTSLL